MLLLWKIRFLDTRDKQFKDRDLWLETNTLNNVDKVVIEYICELHGNRRRQEMLRYRNLFSEKNYTNEELNDHGSFDSFFIENYFEDENGNAISDNQIAVILTGNPNAISIPPGAKNHDIDYIIADKRPIPIDKILLTDKQLKIIGYFVRDLREIIASAFFKDGAGSLTSGGGKPHELKTAVTDEEIRSFVTIFRRLYMEKEPANYLKAIAVVVDAIKDYPLSNWLKGSSGEYESELKEKPHFIPSIEQGKCTFTRKRLIDVFLYTQYAHQPSDERSRQFRNCLAEVNNNQPLLTWIFLVELRHCSLQIYNAGKIIADFYDRYCQCHKILPDVLASVNKNNPEIGTLEKKADRQRRLFEEKAKALAIELWKNSGNSNECPEQYIKQAKEQLKKAITER